MCGLTAEQWSAIGAIATALASLIAALALVAAWLGLRQNTRALQIQVLEGVFRDIRELDRQYIAEFEQMSSAQQTAWSATFFNTVEYLCFLVRGKHAPPDALKAFFFDQALPAWRATFDDHVGRGILGRDEGQFKEFKGASAHKKH